MTKVNDFCLVAGLGLLVVGSTDKVLRVFKIGIKAAKEEDGEVGDVQLEMKGKINKESDSRTIQLTFDNKRSVMLVLSSDNN